MMEPETYLVDGKLIPADECRRVFLKAPLSNRQQQVLELIEGNTVVDVGCYAGLFVTEARRKFPEKTIIGVDYFEDNIRIAHLLFPEQQNNFRRMSVYELKFADGSVDCVTLQEVLEHLEGAGQAVKEINRVLRQGGVVIVSVPNPFYWRDLLRFIRYEIGNRLRRMRGQPLHLGTEIFFDAVEWNRHVFSWTPQTLHTLFAVNGFEYVEHQYERGAGWLEDLILRVLPFFGATQILKVRKVATAPSTLV
jgi:2-polyprenyl-3-methyl-5-hydroxy-6-metoxy-1,4-benzoquinol methylase